MDITQKAVDQINGFYELPHNWLGKTSKKPSEIVINAALGMLDIAEKILPTNVSAFAGYEGEILIVFKSEEYDIEVLVYPTLTVDVYFDDVFSNPVLELEDVSIEQAKEEIISHV